MENILKCKILDQTQQYFGNFPIKPKVDFVPLRLS